MKATGLRPVMGFAVYRPDGTVQKVFAQAMRVTADQRNSLIARAHHDDVIVPDRPAGVTLPADAIAAKKAGYRVVRVTISPTH